MKLLFADTAFYIALVNPHDAFHPKALDLARRCEQRLLTTEYVLVEVGNFLSRSGDRSLFVRLIKALRGDPNLAILPSERILFERGLNLYASRMDKDWSLTDCISFVVMKERTITEALTGDHHFEQAGFKILLK